MSRSQPSSLCVRKNTPDNMIVKRSGEYIPPSQIVVRSRDTSVAGSLIKDDEISVVPRDGGGKAPRRDARSGSARTDRCSGGREHLPRKRSAPRPCGSFGPDE